MRIVFEINSVQRYGYIMPINVHCYFISDDGFHEILVRWYQFGCFTPIFRIHGGGSNTEYWNYGPDVEASMLKTDNLR